MYKYPKMVSLLVKHYSFEDNIYLQEVGRNCLQALVYEIIYEQKIKICNENLVKSMIMLCKRELKLNCQDQLLLFFGEKIFIQQLTNEKQIAKETLHSIIKEFNFSELGDFSICSRNQEHNESQSDDESEQDQDQNQNVFLPQTIICENKEQIFQTEGSFMQAYVPQILLTSDGTIKQQKQQILCYVASLIMPKTELSRFCQTFKISFPEYNRQKQGHIYHVTAILEVDSFFTNYVPKKYEFKAKFANLKRAENQAALGLLEKIWIDYPEIWRKFTSIRHKNNKC